ncbi:MAG: membrane protein insertase YidC [Bacteroidales bacterium]|nr:membrane protein insertase YidC [Bacteroidales bacterium]
MDKNTVIGFILIGCILFGFSFYQNHQYKKQAAEQHRLDSLEQVRLDSLAAIADTVKVLEGEQAVAAEQTASIYKDSLFAAANNAQGQILTIENDRLAVAFNTRGAQVHSVQIKDYKAYGEDSLFLIKPAMSRMGINIYAGQNINTEDFTFEVAESTDSTLVMRLPSQDGGYIQLSYALSEGSYELAQDIAFVGMNKTIPARVGSFDLDWSVVIPRLEKGYKNEKQYSKVDVYFSGDKKPEEYGRGRDAVKSIPNKLKWFAFQQQFFSAIMTAPEEFTSGELSVRFAQEDDAARNLMTCNASMRADFQHSDNIVVPLRIYFGPNKYGVLKAMDDNYEKIIPLGKNVIGLVSRYVIIPCFNFLSRFVSNFGIIILLMTILIKLVISPLTIKSYKSSAKMQALKPEIDKLNEKYPKQEDAMKKQQAQMELYRRADVSPMGGCLPMLLQIPILWAMFRFFPASIELRQQGFLWAEDLSAYDSILDFGFNIPLYGDHISLFAILMAVTMFFYSKMNSSQMSSDPNMKSMQFMTVWMMPIMMLFICNNLSSGLSYYYFLSNLITMLQTWVIKKWFVNPEEVLAKLKATPAKAAKKSKWMQRLEEAQRMQQQQMKNRK